MCFLTAESVWFKLFMTFQWYLHVPVHHCSDFASCGFWIERKVKKYDLKSMIVLTFNVSWNVIFRSRKILFPFSLHSRYTVTWSVLFDEILIKSYHYILYCTRTVRSVIKQEISISILKSQSQVIVAMTHVLLGSETQKCLQTHLQQPMLLLPKWITWFVIEQQQWQQNLRPGSNCAQTMRIEKHMKLSLPSPKS